MALVQERPIETAGKRRPRFSRKLEDVALRLPGGRKLGAVIAAVYGPKGDMFILHQPNAQSTDPTVSEDDDHWMPNLVHVTASGDYINAWTGRNRIPDVDGVSQWPDGLEGLECDDDGNLWIFGHKENDTAVLKFSPSGELLLRLGQRCKPGNDDDTKLLNRATSCYHDTKTREVFISDGYGNHRIVAFNADTGAFTRMWGAYGKKPSSLPTEEGFANPVHKVALGPTGKLYVGDRINNRVQEFELIPGGARFTREVFIAPGTKLFGSAFDIDFSPDGKYMYVADGTNFRIWSVDFASFEVLGSTTVHTEDENEVNLPLHYTIVHRFTVEKNGDLLLACVNRGLKRMKFLGVS